MVETFDSRKDVRRLMASVTRAPQPFKPRHVLMVSPEYFRVAYAINPYMSDSQGQLQTVSREKAAAQWMELKRLYQSLGYQVHVLDGHPELPDMVFAANQSFAYFTEDEERPRFLISNMRSAQRAPEPRFFQRWYEENGYRTQEVPRGLAFEGCGDALLHPTLRLILGGYGPRTDKAAYDFVARETGIPVVRLALRNPNFYHLDTCLVILNETTAAFHANAFDDEGIGSLREIFPQLLDVTEDDALDHFACNAHCPNGRDVLLNRGGLKLPVDLRTRGFQVHELDTSEFLKSGGSVFCLKMMF